MVGVLVSVTIVLVMCFLASSACKRELLRNEMADRPKHKKAA
jgi:hypothetical protein